MDWKGKINFDKAITLKGKPHGIDRETTLPTFDQPQDEGRVVFTEDTKKLWVGTDTEWSELTPGGIGVHYHDDVYYTETEIDDFFEGESGGKKQVDWINITTKPTEFTPADHDNTVHSATYIEVDAVNFTNLSDNGAVGTSSNQVAVGSHNHDSSYAPLNPPANSITYDNTTSGLSSTDVQGAIDTLDLRIDYSENAVEGIFWVDNTRTDPYTETGNLGKPFKTISAAITYITTNHSGKGTIMLAESEYDETFTLGPKMSLKGFSFTKIIGSDTVTIGDGSTNGSNLIENVVFEKEVIVNMVDSVRFSNVTIQQAGFLTLTAGSIEGDISVQTNSTSPALVMNGGVLFGYNSSFTATQNSVVTHNGGELILSNSDIYGVTTDTTLISTSGIVNLSDTRVINASGSGPALSINNGATVGNPNILSNVYKVGAGDSDTAVTLIDGVFGDSTITGTAQAYRTSKRIGFDPSTSTLTSTTVQGAIDELANSHSDFQLTTTIYVDKDRTDTYTPTGAIDRPFTNIDDAIAAAEAGDTIFLFKGGYSSSGTITLPDNVNLIGMGQGKSNIYSPLETGANGKCRLEHISFRNTLTINTETYVEYIYANTTVTLNAGLQGEGFSIMVDSGPALIMNSGGSTMTLNTLSTTDTNESAVVMNAGCGVLTLQAAKIQNNSATEPALNSDGGSVILLTTSLINTGGGLAADLENESTTSNPNMLSNVIHVGGMDTDASPTIIEGVHGGDPSGTAMALRPATQIGYDPTSSGLSLTTLDVQSAIDEVAGSLGTGSAVNISYNNTDSTLDSVNVKEALDELDAEKVGSSHNHNSLYYTQSQIDTNYLSKSQLSDVTLQNERAAYQEVNLTGQNESDPSGLTPGDTYDFTIDVDSTGEQTFSITPGVATAGYQELGLGGVDAGTDSGLSSGIYYFKIKVNDNTLNQYSIELDPAEAASHVGTEDLSSGYNWENDNQDFDISVNGGSSFTVDLTVSSTGLTDIISEINSVFTSEGVNSEIEAYDAGSNHVGIKTIATGSSETFTLTSGLNDALTTLGMTAGTYTGSDATAGYQDVNLDGQITSLLNESGLSQGNTYNFVVNGSSYNIDVLGPTSGYQELGLSGISGGDDSGLTAGTVYNYNIKIDGGSATPQTVTLSTGDKEVTEVTCPADSSQSLSGAYWLLYSANDATEYYVWYRMQETAAQPASHTGTADLSSGYTGWSSTPEDFNINYSGSDYNIVLDTDTTDVATTVTEINNSLSTAGLSGIEAFASSNNVGLRTTAAGSTESFTLSAGDTVDALSTLGMTAGTYTGSDATYSTDPAPSGKTPLQVNISEDDTADSVASATQSIIDGNSNFDATVSTNVVTTTNADTGVTTDANDPASNFTFTITTQGTNDSTTYNDLVTVLSSVTGVTWSITGGDLRATSDTTGISSTIELSAGGSPDLLAALGASLEPSMSGSDGTDTTWDSILFELNTETSGIATWTEESGNIRCTNDTTGSSSTITLADGSTNNLFSSLNYIQATHFINQTSGVDAQPASHDGTVDVSGSIDFTDKRETLVINSTTVTLDADTINLTEVIAEVNDALTPLSDLQAYDAGSNHVGIRTIATGSSETFTINSGDGLLTLGWTAGTYTGADATDTTWSNIISLMNASTISSCTWTIVSGDVRCTADFTGDSSTIDLQPGDTNDLYNALGASTPYDTAVDGTDASDLFSDVLTQMNSSTTIGVTWTWESGNIRATRDMIGSSYSVIISAGPSNDLFSNLNGYIGISSAVSGLDEDTTTGSDWIGVEGIEGVTPTGKSVGDSGTLQEVLEGVATKPLSLTSGSPSDSPLPGTAKFDTSTNILYVYNGTSWVSTTLS